MVFIPVSFGTKTWAAAIVRKRVQSQEDKANLIDEKAHIYFLSLQM